MSSIRVDSTKHIWRRVVLCQFVVIDDGAASSGFLRGSIVRCLLPGALKLGIGRQSSGHRVYCSPGVVNKFLTVVINVLIFGIKHASRLVGLFCLIFSLVGGVLYQQSVNWRLAVLHCRRETVSNLTGDDNEGDEESQLIKMTDELDGEK
ncbi:hypothetical protein NC652_039643 [Populus alba x Populus x berolinensis]|nr:hypothetical protein NC652_039643 [Populus alba x Populus x berolinensis]